MAPRPMYLAPWVTQKALKLVLFWLFSGTYKGGGLFQFQTPPPPPRPDPPRGALLVGTRPQRGGGGSTDPKFVARNNIMCRGRRRFCFRHTAGVFFLFDPMCLYSKYSEFR